MNWLTVSPSLFLFFLFLFRLRIIILPRVRLGLLLLLILLLVLIVAVAVLTACPAYLSPGFLHVFKCPSCPICMYIKDTTVMWSNLSLDDPNPRCGVRISRKPDAESCEGTLFISLNNNTTEKKLLFTIILINYHYHYNYYYFCYYYF